jgi:acetyl esterase/lipase
MKTAYDPAATFELKVSEVEVRRTPGGRMLMARIYQPQGAGPFPTLLDLHGGAWNRKDRFAEEPMDRAVAASGVLVVAIDMTLAPEAPYPACVQDANYGVRWLKSKAAGWNGDPSKVGIYGSSSGGHVAQLLGMRPRDARYNAIPCRRPRTSMRRWPTSRRAHRSATRTRASSKRRRCSARG